MKVAVLGATGKLGQKLVTACLARGHEVTAATRQPARFTLDSKGSDNGSGRLRLVQIDATDPATLDAALAGRDAVINAAGNVADGQRFVDLFDCVVAAAERTMGSERRLWMLACAMILDIPNAGRIGLGLPFVPRRYAPHLTNWRRLERSSLDWVLMCPGPMVAADRPTADRLVLSIDTLPFEVGRWVEHAPSAALSLLMKNKLQLLKVPYRGVADIIADYLEPGGLLSRHRVGAGWRDAREAEMGTGARA